MGLVVLGLIDILLEFSYYCQIRFQQSKRDMTLNSNSFFLPNVRNCLFLKIYFYPKLSQLHFFLNFDLLCAVLLLASRDGRRGFCFFLNFYQLLQIKRSRIHFFFFRDN